MNHLKCKQHRTRGVLHPGMNEFYQTAADMSCTRATVGAWGTGREAEDVRRAQNSTYKCNRKGTA